MLIRPSKIYSVSICKNKKNVDVRHISTNLFGKVWRANCSNRNNLWMGVVMNLLSMKSKLQFALVYVVERFQKLPGKVVQFNNDAVIRNIKTADMCAYLCNGNVNFTCNSFEYCPSSKVCTLSKIHTDDGNVVSSTQQCDLYDRTFILWPQSYEVIWDLIQNLKMTFTYFENMHTNFEIQIMNVSLHFLLACFNFQSLIHEYLIIHRDFYLNLIYVMILSDDLLRHLHHT